MKLSKVVKFDFNSQDLARSGVVLSPEDKINKHNINIMCKLQKYVNLKCFDDVVF